MTRIAIAGGFAAFALVAATAWAKLPPPPPLDEKGKAAAVKSYQGNMKKAGKPIPKPVAMATKAEPPKGADVKPQPNAAPAAMKKEGEKAPGAPAKDAAKKP